MSNAPRGVLVLEGRSGQRAEVFRGFLFGAPVGAQTLQAQPDRGYGEVVFNTSMTGYQEILTDPSYYGQIICMTAAHIGNTGVNDEDLESAAPRCAGFVVRELSEVPSNWRSQGNLDDYLHKHGIPGLCGVDTRALTLHLRSLGVVRGLILPEAELSQAESLLSRLPPFDGRDLIKEVTTREPYLFKSESLPSTGDHYRVVAVDFGIKLNLLRSLSKLGCEVEVVPATTSAQEILKRSPDGVFLSNGPGDPAAATYAAQAVRDLIGQVPIFGVCMGHQILSLAMGARTYKLKFGHRGGNQPVIDLLTDRVEISSHNHGYAVDGSCLPSQLEVTHWNLNDRTIEGVKVTGLKGAQAFSVQYHPEACPGPHDSVILFKRFIDLMAERKSRLLARRSEERPAH